MNVKKFTAATAREALRKLREAMGADSVIISNRTVNGQVEILALAEDDMVKLSAPDAIPSGMNAEKERQFPSSGRSVHAAKAASRPQSAQSAGQESLPKPVRRMSSSSHVQYQAQPGQTQSYSPEVSQAIGIPAVPGVAELMSELRSMRGMMETQLAEISWGHTQRKEPHKAQMLRHMLSSGFSASLARYMLVNMPATANAEQGLAWLKAVMVRNLSSIGCENDMLERGGVFALVGPTGVGKTTTTAKLAARCVMRHGANKLALITTDGYRIGGYEQLRIYGKILGVMVHTVKDQADLHIALSELRNKHTVLIDTVGMSQRDRLVSEQVSMLSGSNVKRLLCLNATATAETLSEVVQSYKGSGLAGCIITKLDEAATLGCVLDSVMRQKLMLYYVANGQRVPEDLHVANKQYLVEQAFKLKRDVAAYHVHDDELPTLMAGASAAMREQPLREVSLG